MCTSTWIFKVKISEETSWRIFGVTNKKWVQGTDDMSFYLLLQSDSYITSCAADTQGTSANLWDL